VISLARYHALTRLRDEARRLHGQGRSQEARLLIEQQAGEYPELARATYLWRIGYAAAGGEVDAAVRLLEEALAAGHWDAETPLRAHPDLKGLQGHSEFERLAALSIARAEEAQRAARPACLFVPAEGEARAVMMALHGNSENAQLTASLWQPPRSLGLAIAFPQSSVVWGSEAYFWKDRQQGLADLRPFYEERCAPFGPERILLGGFSGGAGLAVWAALTGELPVRGVLAVAPAVGEVESLRPLLPAAREGGLRVYILVGTADRECYPGACRLAKMLQEGGLPCHLEEREGLGHTLPLDFDQCLTRAVSFLLD
jgi:hypothetical protein